MKPCRRVGLNVTKKCNVNCIHCFYRYSEEFNTEHHVSPEEIKLKMVAAKKRGCNHALAIGWGEPMMYRHINEFVANAKEVGLHSSIITNGVIHTSKYEKLYDLGIDHIHLSVHAIGDTFDKITRTHGSWRLLEKNLIWLKENNLPFRTNTTIQQENFESLPDIVRRILNYRPYHVVLLGYLPIISQRGKLEKVMKSYSEIRSPLERALGILEENGVFFTLRYHPFCKINMKYWKYITNTPYVVFDPWEWEYGLLTENLQEMYSNGMKKFGGVLHNDVPCEQCAVKLHCGGVHKAYFKFEDDVCEPVKLELLDVGEQKIIEKMGLYFDRNPANSLTGYIQD